MAKKKIKIPNIFLEHLTNDLQKQIIMEGFSIHNSIIIVWSKGDKTEDFIQFLDELPEAIRKKLILIAHQDDKLEMMWDRKIPKPYELTEVVIGGESLTLSSFEYLIHTQ